MHWSLISAVMHVPEWLPGAGFKRMARTACERGEVMKEVLYDDVRAQIVRSNENLLLKHSSSMIQAQGTADLSFAAHLIQANVNPSPEEEDLYKRTAVTVYAGKGEHRLCQLPDAYHSIRFSWW